MSTRAVVNVAGNYVEVPLFRFFCATEIDDNAATRYTEFTPKLSKNCRQFVKTLSDALADKPHLNKLV